MVQLIDCSLLSDGLLTSLPYLVFHYLTSEKSRVGERPRSVLAPPELHSIKSQVQFPWDYLQQAQNMYLSRSKCIFHWNCKIYLQKETSFLITQAILSYRARFHRFCSSFMSAEFHLPVTEHRLKQFSHTFQTCVSNVIDLDIMLKQHTRTIYLMWYK